MQCMHTQYILIYIHIHSTCIYIWHINAYINTFTTIRATRLTASAVSIISHFIVVVIATRLTIIIRTLISSASDSARQAARGKKGRDTVVANWKMPLCEACNKLPSLCSIAALNAAHDCKKLRSHRIMHNGTTLFKVHMQSQSLVLSDTF